MHHRRACGKVGTETHPIGVCNPDARRHDIVSHPWHLVEAVDLENLPSFSGGAGTTAFTLSSSNVILDLTISLPGGLVLTESGAFNLVPV
jgi:hypothetical protein